MLQALDSQFDFVANHLKWLVESIRLLGIVIFNYLTCEALQMNEKAVMNTILDKTNTKVFLIS